MTTRERVHLTQKSILSESRLHWALGLFIIHLALSLSFCFLVFPRLGDATSGLDPDGYGSAGEIWYTSGRFDVINKAPLYPGFVAMIAWLSGGYKIWDIQVAQCLLSAFSIVVLYFIFLRTLDHDGDGMARLTGLACAVYPMSLWYIPRLWTETFLTLGIALFTLSFVKLLQAPTGKNALLCGLIAGAAALSKGIALVFTPLTVLILALRFRKNSARWIVLFLLGSLLLVLPWTWRNWRITGTFLPVHVDSGYNFYLGNGFTRHWREAPVSYVTLKALTIPEMEAVLGKYNNNDEKSPQAIVQQDQILLAAGLKEITNNPLLLLKKLILQSLTFWYLAGDRQKSLLTGVLQVPVLLLALPGIVRAVQRRSWALCLLIPITGIMSVSVLVFSFARLSITVMPYLIGLAIYGLWPHLQKQRPSNV